LEIIVIACGTVPGDTIHSNHLGVVPGEVMELTGYPADGGEEGRGRGGRDERGERRRE